MKFAPGFVLFRFGSLALVRTVPQQLKLVGVVLAFAAATLLAREPKELA